MMRLTEFFRLSKPRDAPGSSALPAIRDNVRDSGTIFTFGTANSGERVDEKSAMQIATVYACVRLLAESVAQLPLHLYRYTDGGIGMENTRRRLDLIYENRYRLASGQEDGVFTIDLFRPGTVGPSVNQTETT